MQETKTNVTVTLTHYGGDTISGAFNNRGICKSRESDWWENKNLDAKLKSLFHHYIASRKDKVIVLRGVITKTPCIVPYTTRFDGNYREEVMERLGGVVIKSGTHLTLTCDLKRFSNLIDASQAVKRGWDRVRGAIKKTFNKSGVVANNGNGWCYWLTNVKFYSCSANLIPETDKEIVDHGWFKYVDYWSGDMRWLAPPDNDSQSGFGDIFGADPDMEEAKRWMKYYAVWEPQRG